MKRKILTKDQELIRYREKTRRFIEVNLPLSYLKKSKVVVFESKNREMIAGYCIAVDPPFRSLMPVPIEITSKMIPWLQSALEVNGVWIHPSHRKGMFAAYFWSVLLGDLLRVGKPYYLYSYSSHKTKLARFYAMSNPIRVWSGDVYIGGMDKPDREIVEIAHRRNLLKFAMKNFFLKAIGTLELGLTRRAGYQQKLQDVGPLIGM